MPFVSKKPKLKLSEEEKNMLEECMKSRTEKKSRVERAGFLYYYYMNKTISEIARIFHTNRPKVERCVNKALLIGVDAALNDLPRKGKPAKIDMNARTWLLSVACKKPKDLGFASEFWTTNVLADYIRSHCEEVGHICLKNIGKGTVSKILNKSDIRPHKVSYYLERRDTEHDLKMTQVLHVYKEVELCRESGKRDIVILSYDEKPGIQAINNIAPDLAPVPGKYPTWGKDHEYKRLGTLSLLASIDLINGKINSMVFDRHRSKEFVTFLKHLDSVYPKNVLIKIILDNHSAHISKETMKYLNSVQGRFSFVFTPKHASWLNLIEMFFSKMTRSFLRGIRVASKEELKQRILKYIDEINQSPVIFRWHWKMDEIKI